MINLIAAIFLLISGAYLTYCTYQQWDILNQRQRTINMWALLLGAAILVVNLSMAWTHFS